MTLHFMSDKELSRLEVLRDLTSGRLAAAAAAELLGLERQQVQRLANAYQEKGPRPSSQRSAADRATGRRRCINVGRETLRIWRLEASLWADRQQRRDRVYQPRYRRECVGDLVHVDGSEHYWFEDRGPSCTLLVFIDDAPSRLMHLQFVQSESNSPILPPRTDTWRLTASPWRSTPTSSRFSG